MFSYYVGLYSFHLYFVNILSAIARFWTYAAIIIATTLRLGVIVPFAQTKE